MKEFLTERAQIKFWKRVDKNGPVVREDLGNCWIWTGCFADRYGAMSVPLGDRQYLTKLAHRVSFYIAHGHLPDEMHVCHHCDMPHCVRPSHLFLGTPGDNARDRNSKNRQAKGVQIPHAKMTNRKVLRARNLYSQKLATMIELARMFEVSLCTMQGVLHETSWTHVKESNELF